MSAPTWSGVSATVFVWPLSTNVSVTMSMFVMELITTSLVVVLIVVLMGSPFPLLPLAQKVPGSQLEKWEGKSRLAVFPGPGMMHKGLEYPKPFVYWYIKTLGIYSRQGGNVLWKISA